MALVIAVMIPWVVGSLLFGIFPPPERRWLLVLWLVVAGAWVLLSVVWTLGLIVNDWRNS